MKLAQLLDDNFNLVLNGLRAQKLPVQAAYKLKTIQKRIDEELMKYEELRREIIGRYGKRDDKGALITNEQNTVQFDDDKQLDFFSDMSDLVNLDVEIGTIQISELGPKAELSADEALILDGFLVE